MDLLDDPDRQADVAHPAKPVEQLADVVRLWCNRHRLEPGERRNVHRCIKHQQPVEFGRLLVGHARKQGVRRSPARAGPASNRDALDDVAGR
jgi:hypothetical protein